MCLAFLVALIKISLGIVSGPGLFFVFRDLMALLSSSIFKGYSCCLLSIIVSSVLTIFLM